VNPSFENLKIIRFESEMLLNDGDFGDGDISLRRV
jgi:hypothetical protein